MCSYILFPISFYVIKRVIGDKHFTLVCSFPLFLLFSIFLLQKNSCLKDQVKNKIRSRSEEYWCSNVAILLCLFVCFSLFFSISLHFHSRSVNPCLRKLNYRRKNHGYSIGWRSFSFRFPSNFV